MAYTFAVDTEQITELANTLSETKTSVGDGIEGIFGEIDGMGEEGGSWRGTSYDSFSEGAHNYQTALNNVPEVIGAFKQALDDSVGPAGEAVSQIDSAIGTIGG